MENFLSFSGLLISFFAIIFIIVKKIPVIENIDVSKFERKKIFSKKLNKIIIFIKSKVKSFSFYDFLHKLVFNIKILNLKAEKITDFWLKKLRQKKIKKDREP